MTVDTAGTMRLHQYGTGTKEASDLTKTESSYIPAFATDGTIVDKQFIMPHTSVYNGTSDGFFYGGKKIGYQVSNSNRYHVDYADTTGYWEKSTYPSVGSNYSGIYGDSQLGSESYTELYSSTGSAALNLGVQSNIGFY